jgi:hypothetical protein
VPDGAPDPQPFQQAADERQVAGRVRRLGGPDLPLPGPLQAQVQVPAEGGDRRRVVEGDVGRDRPGQLQRPALPGPQAELQHRRERQPVADQLPHLAAAGLLAAEQRIDARLFMQVGRDDGGEGLRVLAVAVRRL